MAVRLYEPFAGGTKLRLYIDPQVFVLADDVARRALINDQQGLLDPARTDLAICKNAPDLATFDQQQRDEDEDILDRADYPNYETRVHQITVADGAWFSPIAVDAGTLCGEEVGQEASRAIDGISTTFWRHTENHQHVIVFELRAYPKKIAKIRFLYGANESGRERLNNMSVHAAKAINKLDDPDNILETGINIVWPTGISVDTFVEHTLAKKKNKARFVKLVIDDTDNSTNQAQIRDFEVWVETRDP